MQKNKIIIIIAALLGAFIIGGLYMLKNNTQQKLVHESIPIKTVSQTILAQGVVRSENEATLTFPMAGKLVYLPFKEGDTVYSGQTIAQLDTYALQRQLEIALNAYTSTRDTFDQTQQNAQTGVLQGQQRYALEVPNKSGFSPSDTEDNIINDMIKRIISQSQAGLDTSVANVELANYAMQLATLTSPINGMLVHQDVKTAGVTVTPVTTFFVADPNALVFRANVDETDIQFIQVGQEAKITLAGKTTPIAGIVEKIYPQKTTLPTGENVYAVDVASDGLRGSAQLLQSGSVTISNKYNQIVMLVPHWMVLGGQYVWVVEKGKLILKQVTVGDTVGTYREILAGLTHEDMLIQNPQAIVENKYVFIGL